MSSTEPNADDMSKYHPHDLLIAKFFPDEDILSMGYDSVEYSAICQSARVLERMGEKPPRIPWPMPPPRPSEFLEAAVEQWRSEALRAIDSRIAMFSSDAVPQQTVATQALRAATISNPSAPVHRLLLIPELLELILRQATPQAQHTAWNVSRFWRKTLEHILAYQYRSRYPCPPVGYGERIDIQKGISWMQPSDDDIARVEQETVNASQRPLRELSQVYYPAIIAQASSLSSAAYLAIQDTYERLQWKPAQPNPIDQSRRWIDLSQFRMNPHVVELFGGRMEPKLGHCEISLKAGTGQPCLLRGSLPSGNFANLIADMFLTEPACKAVGIYMTQIYSQHLQLLATVSNKDGVRVGQFLDALHHHAGKLLTRWRSQVEDLWRKIGWPQWADLSTPEQKRRPWIYPASPKFFVFLEQTQRGPRTLAQKAYIKGEGVVTVHLSEWFHDSGNS
ncbi:hypothetical protein ACET3X_003468 [Alternaria dauci]|uniref:F-box domain-containing protein n=1 Tax=Alternaria dauci TaxID=48095 RepID=A0ABR3UVJ4_9PLEO